MIPYGRQQITQADIDSVVDVLKSDFLTQGPVIPRFEECVSMYAGAGHAVAANSATSALHMACLALDLGPGDILWTSPVTFVASSNCGVYCGATVDFVDIDPDTFNMCPVSLRAKLEEAKREERLPKVIVPVHFSGLPCDMEEIHSLAKEYGFRIVEDASHAIGARYKDTTIGDCRYSDIVVFSFHPVKIITSGEGGMALTNDADLARRLRLFSSHCITRDVAEFADGTHGPWYYEQIGLGFNYRMTDIHAALGLSQMSRLDGYVEERNRRVLAYLERLDGMPLKVPHYPKDSLSSWHLFVARVDSERTGVSRRAVFEFLRSNGVGVNVHYIPVHLQPYYHAMGFRSGDFPNSEAYYDAAITLPLFPTMTDEQQDTVCRLLDEALQS